MLRLILFGIFLLIFLNEQEINAVQDLYGQSSGRIKSPSNQINPSIKSNDFTKEYLKQQYELSRSRERSSSFIQSRHFHFNQITHDNHGFSQSLSQPYYSKYGRNQGISNQEGCHLTNTYCSHDYQCCSGKCRCIRWSIMGKMSCLKKCF